MRDISIVRCYAAIIGLLLMLVASTAIAQQRTSEKCIIGYGYSNYLVNQERQEHFMMGFKYGLRKGYEKIGKEIDGPCNSLDSVQFETVKKNSKGEMDAYYAAKELISKEVILLSGFPTSHEATLAAVVAKEHNIGLLVLGASNDKLAQYKDYIFTTSPPNRAYVEHQLTRLSQKYKGGKVLLVIKKDSVFSVNVADDLQRINNDRNYGLNIIPVYLNSKLTINDSQINEIGPNNIAAVYITSYASESKSVLRQLLKKLPNDIVYYVSGAWPLGDPTDLFDLRSQFDNPVLAVAIWTSTIGSNGGNKFTSEFEKVFRTNHPVEFAHGYEAGVAAAHILSNAKSNDRKSVLESLRNIKCIPVDTVGEICRDSDGFSKRKFFWMKWTTKGFEIES